MKNTLKQTLIISLLTLVGFARASQAADSLSYSGRLVQSNGAPVAGPVTIRAQLAYTNALSTILCTKDIPNVVLTKGVFHVKLNLDCTASGLTLNQVLAQAPAGESVAIRIIDVTNSKTYSFQAVHSLPYAQVAEQLSQMGATNNQVLKWNSGTGKWEPGSISGAGTVTSVSASLPLSVTNGSTTPAITIAQANGTTSGYLSSADWTNFNSKSSLPAGGTTAHYFRGDGSWQTLNTAAVTEDAAKLYFTNARALGVPLAGLVLANSAIANADTFIEAFGKTQGQINALNTAQGNYLLKSAADTLSGNVSLTSVITASVTGDIIVNSTPLTMTSAVNKAYVDTQRDTRLAKSGGTLTGDLTLDEDLLIKGSGNTNYVTVKAHATTANYNFVLPQTAGTAGYVLRTDGSGNLSWMDPNTAVGSATITDGSIVDDDINASANIAQSKIAGLSTSLAGKVSTTLASGNILVGSAGGVATAVAVSGDATLSNTGSLALTTTGVTGGTYTSVTVDTKGRVTGGSNPATVKSLVATLPLDLSGTADDPVITLPPATTSDDGYLKATDWAIFNAKQAALSTSTDLLGDQVKIYNGANYVELKSPVLGGNVVLTLPTTDGNVNQVLQTDGNGVLSWVNLPAGAEDWSTTGVATIEPTRINLGTANRALVTNGSGTPVVSSVTATELSYVSGVTSSIQTQLNAKLSATLPTCGAGEVLKSDGTSFSCVTDNAGAGAFSGTAERVVVTNASGDLAVSAVTNTELSYVGGVTGSIQTQLGGKQATLTSTSDVLGDQVRIYNGANYVELKSPTLAGNVSLTFPTTDGSANQVLQTDGDGILSWVNLPTTSGTSFADGDIPQAKVNGLVTALAGKEPTITAGTSAQYYRGDKTFATLDTDAVAEGTKLYFTDARAKAASVIDAIVDGVLDIAPSQNAVFDALANKLATTGGSITVGTINGIPTPVNDDDVTNKSYVDTRISYSAGIGNLIPGGAKLLMKTCVAGFTENGTIGTGLGNARCNGSDCKICENGPTASLLPASSVVLMEMCPYGWTHLGFGGIGSGAAGRTYLKYSTCQSPATTATIPQGARLIMAACPSDWKDLGGTPSTTHSYAECNGVSCRICEAPGTQANAYIVGANTSDTGPGGSAIIEGGPGGSTSGDGGGVYLYGGTPTNGSGGSVSIIGANGVGYGSGGSVFISAGLQAGGALDGNVIINSGGQGMVGIGVSSPTHLLDIRGANGRVNIQSTTVGNQAVLKLNNGINTTIIGSENSTPDTVFYGTTSNASVIGTNTALPIQFATGANVRMTISGAGKVGIGNAAPDSMLDLGKNGGTIGTLRFHGNTSGYVEMRPAAAAGSWTMTLPADDGTNGQVLITDGNGVTSWSTLASNTINAPLTGFATGTNSAVVATDTVLEAFGKTQTQLNNVVDWSVAGIQSIEPTRVNVGSASRVVVSNASGQLTASSITTTILGYLSTLSSNVQDQINALVNASPNAWTEQTANFTAVKNGRYMINTSGGAVTMTLPATAAMGDTIQVIDASGSFDTNNLTVGRNGLKIMGLSEDMTVANKNISFELVYYNSANGWRLK